MGIIVQTNTPATQLPSHSFALSFGAKDPKYTITAITSPSCGYCQAPFLAYSKLLELYPTTLRLQVVFSVPYNHVDNIATKVARIVTAMYLKQPKAAYEAAFAWYKDRNETEWLKIYGNTANQENASEHLETSMKWCIANNLSGTPVTLLDGYYLPKIYNITDLQWLLADYLAKHTLEES